MYVGNLRWGVPCFLGAAMLTALYLVLSPGTMKDWVLDPLTGLVSLVTVLAACSQVANAAYDRRSNRIWQAVVSILLLIVIAQFFDVLSDTLQRFVGTDDCDDLLILGIAPLMLAVTGRFNPALRRARAAVWAGFLVQVVSASVDLSGADTDGVSNTVLGWAVLTDFTEFVSVSFYLIAISLIVIDTGRAIGAIEISAETKAAGTYAEGRSIKAHAYPPPFVFGWSLPPADTAAGRIHRLCNQALWPAGDMVASARNLWLIVTWPVVALARALKETSKQGGEIALRHGKSTRQQFFEQLGLALRHRISPGSYYTNELFRPARQRDAAHYLLCWEANEAVYKLLSPTGGDVRSEPAPLGNKVDFARHCERHRLRHVPVLAIFEDGSCVAGAEQLPPQSLLLEAVGGEAGNGSERWRYAGNHRYVSDDAIEMSADQLLEYVKMLSHSIPYLVRLLQHNHILISSISASPLATIRILTARTESGGFEVTNAVFRMPVTPGSEIDNRRVGDITALIDVQTGRLGPAADLSGNSVAIWHLEHPLAGGRIEGYQLPMWPEARDLVLRAHRTYGDQALIGWDVALLPQGPTLIAATRGPDVDIIQQASRTALGKTKLGDLLAHNLERRLRTGR
ncbi:sugar-transfer associated ATP-grasp domain-containing protein [Dongia sp.]|uniref:sugar-transfer associated ATP-grasp domain-containing protein n=1 Tax=Dongia sp. TaxID=1977262 RepID=UPI003753CAFE